MFKGNPAWDALNTVLFETENTVLDDDLLFPSSRVKPSRVNSRLPVTGLVRLLFTTAESVAVSPRTRKGGRINRVSTSLVTNVLPRP